MANQINWLFVVIAVAVAYLLIAGNPFEKTTEPTTTVTPGSTGTCNIEDVSFSPKMTRLGKVGTSLSTAAQNYFITTDNIGSVAGGTATTLSSNYNMQVMFGENSTTYYTVVRTINTGCSDPFFEDVRLAYADTSLNSKYAENEDGSVNTAANNQSMGASDIFETTVSLKAGTDTYFGNPNSDCENIAVIQYDKTYILQAYGDNPVAVPGMFSYTNSTYDGSTAFVIPKFGDGEKVEFNVVIESTTSDPLGNMAQPVLTVYDCDFDRDEDSNEVIFGVEDEDQNSLSLANQDLTIYLR